MDFKRPALDAVVLEDAMAEVAVAPKEAVALQDVAELGDARVEPLQLLRTN